MWTIQFIVKWNIDSTIEVNKAINFQIKLEYVQDVLDYMENH